MKVAIIGAGITGLYLAWKLAERGHQVTVFEKKWKIGKEVCSGLFSERILEFIPESQKLIQNEINYCLIHWGPPRWEGKGWGGIPKRTLKVEFSKKFLVINHFELDNLAAHFAKKAGVKIILNSNQRNVISLKNGFDRIIGCDGALSVVRKNLNLAEPNFRLGILGYSFATPQVTKFFWENFVETWPTKSGFIWKIPRKKETEYGIIEEPKRAKIIFEKFLRENNLRLENLKSALIPQGLIIPKNEKITLCGDSAGLTKPWSGGGVVWSLMAANLLLKNFPDFLKYQKEIKKFFLPKIIFSKIAKKLVYFFGFNSPQILPKNFQIDSDFLF